MLLNFDKHVYIVTPTPEALVCLKFVFFLSFLQIFSVCTKENNYEIHYKIHMIQNLYKFTY